MKFEDLIFYNKCHQIICSSYSSTFSWTFQIFVVVQREFVCMLCFPSFYCISWPTGKNEQ